tara:strand:- start:232 stop:483 length:252 start_codon:yes stop_codon:yes gene_type:complete
MVNNNIGASATSNAVSQRTYLCSNLDTAQEILVYANGARDAADMLGGTEYDENGGCAFFMVNGTQHILQVLSKEEEAIWLCGS